MAKTDQQLRESVSRELKEVRREMGSINPKLSLHKNLSDREVVLISRLKELGVDMP